MLLGRGRTKRAVLPCLPAFRLLFAKSIHTVTALSSTADAQPLHTTKLQGVLNCRTRALLCTDATKRLCRAAVGGASALHCRFRWARTARMGSLESAAPRSLYDSKIAASINADAVTAISLQLTGAERFAAVSVPGAVCRHLGHTTLCRHVGSPHAPAEPDGRGGHSAGCF